MGKIESKLANVYSIRLRFAQSYSCLLICSRTFTQFYHKFWIRVKTMKIKYIEIVVSPLHDHPQGEVDDGQDDEHGVEEVPGLAAGFSYRESLHSCKGLSMISIYCLFIVFTRNQVCLVNLSGFSQSFEWSWVNLSELEWNWMIIHSNFLRFTQFYSTNLTSSKNDEKPVINQFEWI